MRKGKSISELAATIKHQADMSRDYVVDTSSLNMASQDEGVQIFSELLKKPLSLNSVSHSQVAARADIPKRYYDRMLDEAPKLLAKNVNTWWFHKPENRMLRTFDGNGDDPLLRAFLSDRYRRMDNKLVVETVLPLLMEHDELEVVSSEVTDRRLYIQVVFPRIQGEIRKGDIVQAGLQLSNSETGFGKWNLAQFIRHCVCDNGQIGQSLVSKTHLGKRVTADADGTIPTFVSDETMEADDKAFTLLIRDATRHALDTIAFDKTLEAMREAKGDTIKSAQAPKALKTLGKAYSLSDDEQGGILDNLLAGGDLSRYGLSNAVTALANDKDEQMSYDRCVELQRMGGKIVEMGKAEFQRLLGGAS